MEVGGGEIVSPEEATVNDVETVERPENETVDEKDVEEDEWLDILGSGHIKKKVVERGQIGTRPRRGDPVVVELVGSLEDGTVIERLEGVEICVGDGDVLQGVDLALPLMDEGETAELMVGPRFGYGALGDPPQIPPNANITYRVKLVEVKDPPEAGSLSVEERLDKGREKKERGNWWYRRKEYRLAVQCYRKSLLYLEEDGEATEANCQEVALQVHNNLSAAHLYLESYDDALTSLQRVIRAQPTNVKALYRKIKVLKEKGETEEALAVAKEALQVAPHSAAIKEELRHLKEQKRETTTVQKRLYKKMFSDKPTKDNKRSSRIFLGLSVNKWVGIVTVAIGLLGAAAVKYKY